MSLLGDLMIYADSLRRTAGNSLRDMVSDPIGLLSQRAAQVAESLPAHPDERSVMPEAAGLLGRPSMQDWATGIATQAPTTGLLGHISNVGLKTLPGGLFADDAGNVFKSHGKMPSGAELWSVGSMNKGGQWIPYAPEMRYYRSLDDARAGIRAEKMAARTHDAEQKYSAIPRSWAGESRKIAKRLIDSGISVDDFSMSTQSRSKYVQLADGRKIRLSDHALPRHYEAADIDFRLGGDIQSLIDMLSAHK
jgi:hypothetical protein